MKNTFLINASYLAVGSFLSRIIISLSMIILARIYRPDDFETLAIFVSITSVFTVIAGARFYLAIPLADTEEESLLLVCISLLICLATVLIVTVFLIVILQEYSIINSEAAGLIWLLPIIILLNGCYQVLQYWITRLKNFRAISITRITKSTATVIVQITYGMYYEGPNGLILGLIANGIIGITSFVKLFYTRFSELGLSKIFASKAKKVFVKYSKYPILSVPEALFNTAGAQIPVLVIAAYSINAEGGQLFLALQLLTLPLAIVGRSIGQAFLSESKEKFESGALTKFTIKTLSYLFLLSIIPMGLAAVLAPILAVPVLGENWQRAGEIIRLLVPMAILQFLVSPLSTVFHVMNLQKYALYIQIFGFAIRVLPITILIILGANSNLTNVFALTSTLFYGVYIVLIVVTVHLNGKRNILS